MSDLDRLHELGRQVSPPAFESLVGTARRRDRRTAAATVVAVVVVLVLAGGLATRGDRRAEAPADKPPTPGRVVRLPQTSTDDRRVLEQGRYQLAVLDADTLWYRVDVPEGWQSQGGMFLHPPGTGQAAFLVAGAPEMLGVARQPCRDHTKAPTGPGVGDLVQGMADQPVLEVSQPVPVRLGGARGQYIEVRVPAAFDARACEQGLGNVGFFGTGAGDMWSGRPGYLGQWWVLDVEDQRVVVMPWCQQPCAGTTARDLKTMAQSIHFVAGP